jgi:hypothetical protein
LKPTQPGILLLVVFTVALFSLFWPILPSQSKIPYFQTFPHVLPNFSFGVHFLRVCVSLPHSIKLFTQNAVAQFTTQVKLLLVMFGEGANT